MSTTGGCVYTVAYDEYFGNERFDILPVDNSYPQGYDYNNRYVRVVNITNEFNNSGILELLDESYTSTYSNYVSFGLRKPDLYCFDVGTHRITYTISDLSNNTNECSIEFTVFDDSEIYMDCDSCQNRTELELGDHEDPEIYYCEPSIDVYNADAGDRTFDSSAYGQIMPFQFLEKKKAKLSEIRKLRGQDKFTDYTFGFDGYSSG
jgi:hypothetical protein